jgi:chemotaxis protein methyltransferase CheR
MVLDPLLEGCDWKILATDISTRVLGRAASGLYNDEEVEPIPEELKARYLKPAASGDDGQGRHQIAPRLRDRIVFRRLNLSVHPYPMGGPLDAVFCRNVMIYFDRPMRAGLVSDVERLLRPGCYFFIGHSETLNGIPTRLKGERPSVYRRPEEAA